MSLQVLSPQQHRERERSDQPQSPYPCTPSDLGGSSPASIHGGQHQQHYFRPVPLSSPPMGSSNVNSTSYFARQRLATETSPLALLAAKLTLRHNHAQNGSSQQQQSDAHAGTPSTDGMDGDDTMLVDLDNMSAVSGSPEMPVSISSPSMSSLGGRTPERLAQRSRATGDSPSTRSHHRTGTDSSIGAATPSTSSPAGAHSTRERRAGGNDNGLGMRSHPSTASIPIILAGLNGNHVPPYPRDSMASTSLSMATPTLHGKESSADSTVDMLTSVDEEDANDVHPEYASLSYPQDNTATFEAESSMTTERGSIETVQSGASVGLGLGILDDPIQLREPSSRRSSRSKAYFPPSSSHGHSLGLQPLSSISAPPMKTLWPAQQDLVTAEELAATRQDRADSWSSSLLSLGNGSLASSASSSVSPSTPGPSPTSAHAHYHRTAHNVEKPNSYFPQPELAVPRRASAAALQTAQMATIALPPRLGSPIANLKGSDSPYAGSEFSVSAYEYSPHVRTRTAEGQFAHRWSAGIVESNMTLAPAAVIQEADSTSAADNKSTKSTSRPGTAASEKRIARQRKKAEAALLANSANPPPKEVKKRRRAATLANPLEGGPAASDARRQSSPPTMSATRFVDNYATISAASAKKRPEPITTRWSHLQDAEASEISPAAASPSSLFKPLPALPPIPQYGQQQQYPQSQQTYSRMKRPGFLSVQTSPRRPAFSRPGTASPAARVFGLVAGPPASPARGDYTSLASRDPLDSDSHRTGPRSRSASIVSQKTGSNASSRLAEVVAASSGPPASPPKFITLHIDQESFRAIAPVFRLVESSNNEALPTGMTLRYVPVHTEQFFPFHHSTMETPPTLRRFDTGSGLKTDMELIQRQAVLLIKNEGLYAVNGLSAKGDFPWRFEYRVVDRLNLVGKIIPGEKNVTPLSFTCTPEVLDAAFARKRKAMDVVYKTLSTKLEALRVGDLPH